MARPDIREVQSRHTVADMITFETGPGGLTRASVVTPDATGSVYLHGAHVATYQPEGHDPVLFMSGQSLFDPKKAIRGGVPVIFPWFGALKENPAASQHGFARTAAWTVESTKSNPDQSATIVLSLVSSEETRKSWPYDFAARFTATMGKSLSMSLDVRNTGAKPLKFEEALHTYFMVGSIKDASVTGLAGARFIDKTDGFKEKLQDGSPVRITTETDRVYFNTRSACVIEDPKMNRRITVEKTGSNSTVVWNPWAAKAKAMADFGDDEWQRMICVETANAASNAVALKPGESHEMSVTIRCESR